jgi:hypothetical protein
MINDYSLDQLLGGALFLTFRETFCCAWAGEGLEMMEVEI